ncbi:hypothetical protein SASPL_149606 [Salvia splendens]|uniref:Uncharacterized protein n=1 Tax=Salvia splendens TaxID=180675 RepID=A0A8X8WB45_SALSN|nr:hypothetical protein SASPL_149606 [Salvia splendens]
MEPPMGLWASLWSFIRFLPFFIGLLILGVLKGGVFPVFLLLDLGKMPNVSVRFTTGFMLEKWWHFEILHFGTVADLFRFGR